ncbi:MAG TPA: DUF1330 domain-containing protein [Candidatus Binataceae bacterium]|nr:DUF1330 domain-containing protein [Candidatus Binataceae bacterium]
MADKVVIVAALYVHPGHEKEFEVFETAAETIINRHGGRLERRIGFPAGANPDHPHEVHLVTFPDEDSFAHYRADTDLQALAELRARAIRQTVIWMGRDLGSFLTP